MAVAAETKSRVLYPGFTRVWKRALSQGINREHGDIAGDELGHFLEFIDERFEKDEVDKKHAEVLAVKVGHLLGRGTKFSKPLFDFVINNKIIAMESKRTAFVYFTPDGFIAYAALTYCYLQLFVPKRTYNDEYVLVPGDHTFTRLVPETKKALGKDNKLALLLNDPQSNVNTN